MSCDKMATDATASASSTMASKLLSQSISAVFETSHAAKAVVIQRENFNRFSSFLENIVLILKQLLKLGISHSDSLSNAIEILYREVTVAKELVMECSKRNKLYLLMNCQKIIKCLEGNTKEIGRALGLIPLASLDVSLGINDEIRKLCSGMIDTEYRTAAMEEEILEKIEWGKQQRNIDRSYVNNLLLLIAKAIGISNEPSVLKKEFEEFKSEVGEARLRKDMREALRMEQVIVLLGKADATTATSEEKEISYFAKLKSLGRQPLEPLHSFYCPLTQDVMVDPVETPFGKTYERSAIEEWLSDSTQQFCPLTGTPLCTSDLRPNKNLRQSIEEWKERNIMITIASMKPILQSKEEQEVIDMLGKLQHLCIQIELHREWVIMEDYPPILIGLLAAKNYEIRKRVLAILYLIAKDRDGNKERIAKVANAIESIVHSLARPIEESKLALRLLLELSQSNLVRETIGNAQGCILLLVTMSSSDNSQASKDAMDLLENLSFLEQNVIQMAKANYFRPLLHLLTSGPIKVKIAMAETLSEIELTDHNKLSLFKDGALAPLLEFLMHDDIEMKMAAVKALQNLSSLPQNGLQMIREGALGPLFDLLYRHSLSLPTLREQLATTIMHLAMATTSLEADQEQVSFLESEEDIFKLFSLISLTGSNVQQSILQSFYAMCQSAFGPDIRAKLRQLSVVQVLVQLCEIDNHTVRESAIKLFCCLTKDSVPQIFIEHVNQKCIETLLKIITTSNNVEEVSAAMGIISNVPNDAQLTQWLVNAGAIETIIDCITKGNGNALFKMQVTENAVGALCHFTVSSNQEWQKRVARTGIIPMLVNFLMSGNAAIKQNAAISLMQFSESSIGLTRPVKKPGLGLSLFCFAPPELGCPVHSGICTVESSFCLLEADAVGPLVRVLGEMDNVGACEASLGALLTLIDGERLQRGSKVLAEENAVTAIIKLLSSPHPRLQEKAMEALQMIFGVAELKPKYGHSAQTALIDITQRGNREMKSLAARVLAQLNMLPQQSSYF